MGIPLFSSLLGVFIISVLENGLTTAFRTLHETKGEHYSIGTFMKGEFHGNLKTAQESEWVPITIIIKSME